MNKLYSVSIPLKEIMVEHHDGYAEVIKPSGRLLDKLNEKMPELTENVMTDLLYIIENSTRCTVSEESVIITFDSQCDNAIEFAQNLPTFPNVASVITSTFFSDDVNNIFYYLIPTSDITITIK